MSIRARTISCDEHHESTRPYRARRVSLRGDGGFTLLEALVAAVVLVTGLTALFGLLDTSLKASAATRAREGATNLARQLLEDARTIPYAQLSPNAIQGELQGMNGLADDSPAPGWQVVVHRITYLVSATECSIDDPKDGYGKHVTLAGENPFCKDPGEAEGTSDPQPEDLKRVTVDVRWSAQGRSPDVHQVETFTAAGAAPGLTPSDLHLETLAAGSPTTPIITNTATETLTFAVTSPRGTTAMRWSLEGTPQQPVPVESGETTTWSFSWSIPYPKVSDGTYQVSVQAIDATGVIGPPVSIPVTLIRGAPAAVAGLKGGFNTVNVSAAPKQVVELEWRANTEKNVIGYRVYNPSGQRVCPSEEGALSVALSCIDFNPPSPSASNLTYSVVALYRDANGVVQQGAPGALPIAGGPPPAPYPPAGLTLTKNADGSVTLNWSAPAGGPEVIFYRIYRGSTDYTSRYDVTGSGTTTYTDTDTAVAHSYWVTAVDANLTESTFLGPVSG